MQTSVLIGPFQRRMFAEGLAALLADDPDLEIGFLESEADAGKYMASTSPVVVILESRSRADRPAYLPRSEAVAVILVTQEGQDAQIALRQIDRSRLRAAIGLVSRVPHPRIISLDLAPPSQAPFALPNFRNSETSGLSQVIGWLDATFANALRRHCHVAHRRRPLDRHRPPHRPVHTRRMPQLLRSRRIRCRLMGFRSRIARERREILRKADGHTNAAVKVSV